MRQSWPWLYLAAPLFAVAAFAMGLLHLQADYAIDHPWRGACLVLGACTALLGVPLSLCRLVEPFLVTPWTLPAADFSHGIPVSSTTLIAAPILLDGRNIGACLDAMYHHYQANPDDGIRYVLLTDFADADLQDMPPDGAVLAQLRTGIAALNRRYCPGHAPRFFLLHRPRAWDGSLGKWSGHERKRGKIKWLNSQILERRRTRVASDTAVHWADDVRYVVCLDLDARLEAGGARSLIEILSHPCSRPVSDAAGRIISGYVVLQPRPRPGGVTGRDTLVHMWGRGSFSPPPRGDVHHDLFQDLFGESTFFGKGIYDVEWFERQTGGIPSNLILSHDAVEGGLCRTAYVADVTLTESIPSTYCQEISRLHRWIRGDWQNLIWLLRTRGGGPAMSAPARVNIVENVRRSVAPVAMACCLLAGWVWLPRPGAWLLELQAATFAPPLAAAMLGIASVKPRRPGGAPPASQPWQPRIVLAGLMLGWSRAIFDASSTPYQAYCSLDAASRSCWRVLVSGKQVLQWTPSASGEATVGKHPLPASMALVVLATWACIGACLAVRGTGTMSICLLGAFWASSPLLALAASGQLLPLRGGFAQKGLDVRD